MSAIKNWFKNKLLSLAIAVSNTEKNLLAQDGRGLGEGNKQERKVGQGTLADDLLRGELTQEVKDLRWRMYKVMKAMEGVKVNITMDRDLGEDEEGNSLGGKDPNFIIGESTVRDPSAMKVIKQDESDPYELELSFNNDPITMGVSETLGISSITAKAWTGDTELNEVSHREYDAGSKTEPPIKIVRNFVPKFFIETFAKKLNVRKIDEKTRLLEFYISKYPDEYKFNTKLIIKEIQKIIAQGPLKSNFLQFDEVGFITYKTAGVKDLLGYGYKILNFDKIVEFDGNYIIKFKAEVIVDGQDLTAEYVEEGLEKKYENKEARLKTKE